MPFVDFAEIRERLPIVEAAEMLPVKWDRSSSQLRASCPVHGGDRSLAVTPSKGLFVCQAAPPQSNGRQPGGDCIKLCAHVMQTTDYEAGQYLAKQIGLAPRNSNSDRNGDSYSSTVSKNQATVPPAREKAVTKREPTRSAFDPDKFWASCSYSEELADAGISEDDAARVLIGWHSRYKAHYIGSRNPDGSIAGFTKVDLQTVKFPPTWLSTNVVRLPRRA